MNDKRIGWIGTGIMGAPMVQNLMAARFELTVFNRTRSKAEPLLDKGAGWADSPAQAASATDVVITIVSDSPDVEEVYLGPRGVASTVRKGALCIDMSTVSATAAKEVAEALAKQGVSFLDAPVSGGKTGAEAGTLAIMVGGDRSDVERARPIFEAMGKSIVHCGPVGNGQLTKLCNQVLCSLNLLAVCEAITFANRVGLDPQTMLKAVSGGAAGSWALNNLGPRMLTQDFAPMFMIDLLQKDLQIVLSAAFEASIPLPGTALVSQLLSANQAAGEGREGTQALVKTLQRMASGVKV